MRLFQASLLSVPHRSGAGQRRSANQNDQVFLLPLPVSSPMDASLSPTGRRKDRDDVPLSERSLLECTRNQQPAWDARLLCEHGAKRVHQIPG